MRRSNILLIIFGLVAVVSTSAALYLYFQPEPEFVDNAFLEAQVQRLEQENTELQEIIDSRNVQILRRDNEIDSLESLKPQIKTEYVKIYNEIDNSSTISLVELSDSIYTAEGINN